jgi:Flp pilus assembly protein TadG
VYESIIIILTRIFMQNKSRYMFILAVVVVFIIGIIIGNKLLPSNIKSQGARALDSQKDTGAPTRAEQGTLEYAGNNNGTQNKQKVTCTKGLVSVTIEFETPPAHTPGTYTGTYSSTGGLLGSGAMTCTWSEVY